MLVLLKCVNVIEKINFNICKIFKEEISRKSFKSFQKPGNEIVNQESWLNCIFVEVLSLSWLMMLYPTERKYTFLQWIAKITLPHISQYREMSWSNQKSVSSRLCENLRETVQSESPTVLYFVGLAICPTYGSDTAQCTS